MATEAWKGVQDKDYAAAVASAQKCIDLFKQQALDQQKALTAPATDKDEVFKQLGIERRGHLLLHPRPGQRKDG